MRTKRRFLQLSLLAAFFFGGLLWLFLTGSRVSGTADEPETRLPQKVAHESRGNTIPAGQMHRSPSEAGGRTEGRIEEAPSQVKDDLIVWGTIQTRLGEVTGGESVEMYSPSLIKRHVAVSDAQGDFVFTEVQPASDYELAVSPRGMYKRYHRRGVAVSIQEPALHIVLEPLRVGLLHGEIVNAQGREIPDFPISLRSLSKDRGHINARSDAIGVFELAEFPEGPFEVFSREMLLRITGLRFDIDANETVTLVVDSGPQRLSGQVFDDNGQALVGAIVLLNWTHSKGTVRSVVERKTLTDSFGAFTMEGLGGGQHDIIVSGTRTGSLRQHLDIGAEPGDLVFHLDSDPFD